MKISLLDAATPFAREPVDEIVLELARRLSSAEHRVDHVRLPFAPAAGAALAEQMLAFRLLGSATAPADVTIAVRFPADLLPARRQRVWLLDQPARFDGQELACRQWLERAQRQQWESAEAVYATSDAAADEVARGGGFRVAGVLPLPATDADWDAVVRTLAAA